MYPETILTRRVRRSLMIFLIMIFFIISPLIIFYTAGYRYDFATQQIKETGVISIDVKPQDAIIFLNNVEIKKKSPIRLPNRAPGTYHLIISSPGYQTWEKDITVESKQTTYIRGIVLFKESLPIDLLDFNKENITSAKISPFGDYAFISKKIDNLYETFLYNLKTYTLTSITRSPEYSQLPPEFDWSPYESYGLIKTIKDNNILFQIVNPAKPQTIETVELPIIVNQIQYQWNPATIAEKILFRDDHNIYGIFNGEKKIILNYPELSAIWYVDKNLLLWQFNPNEKNIENIGSNGKIFAFAVEKNITQIIDANVERIIVKSVDDNIAIIPINNKEENRQIINAQSFFYNITKDEWLVWSPWELWAIYADGNANILQRESKNINFAGSLDTYGVILLLADNTIFGFNPGYYVTHQLTKSNEIVDAQVNIQSRKIYFIGTVGTKRGLFELDY